MFNSSKYTKTYYKIVNAAQSTLRSGYLEKHHIIPRSLGGSNRKDNIVSLTAREHYVCHLLLTKMTEGLHKQKMTYAAWTMARTRKINTNSRTYARLKEQATTQLIALQKGVKRGPMSEEHKQKIREASIRRYKDPEQRRITAETSRHLHTEETKANLSRIKLALFASKVQQ
jgi:hypothetical protein